MSDNNKFIFRGIEIEEKKIYELLRWLIQIEKINIKTREKSDQRMVVEIKKKIEEIVECY